MSHGATAPHHDLKRERAKDLYVQVRGMADAFARQAEIDALPAVEWKGKALRTIRCRGHSGNGPHNCNVPEALLWSVMSLQDFLCVYHAGDR